MSDLVTRNLTILLTDIKDFTTQTAKRSRAEISLMLEKHKEIVLPVIEIRGGTLVKTIGDAFLVTFESPTDAVLAGVEVQDAVRQYNEEAKAGQRFDIRIALNQGEVNLADGDVFGDPVNIAARLEEIAEVGEVYFTDAVYLSMNKREVRSVEVGLIEFKGVAEKVRVYKVRREQGTAAALPLATNQARSAGLSNEVNFKLDLPAPASAAAAPAVPDAPPAFVAAAPPSPASAGSNDWGSGPMVMNDPEELIGKDVGPVRIEAVMGRGGMGVVFKGRHKRLDRPVAVKVIIPSIHRSAGASELLLQEARLVARLEDPRIVQVYDVGTQGTLSFIVMQFVDGETLGDRVLREGKLAPKDALAIMKEILQGLAAAHAKGIVHRDLKPSNIMIDKTGAVKLLDFGIAGVTGNEEFAPDATFSGTLDFMAPEQAFGTRADPRMDLYSFGATYFFVLTGMPPFVGNTAVDVLMKHREAPIPDVREFQREATAGVAALLSRLMQKFPEGRPSSAAEVLKELEKPGMTMAVDQSGSPFKILPPPVEAKVGLAAEMEAMGRSAEEVSAAAQAPLPAGGPAVLPPPPPAVDFAPGRIPASARVIFAALFFVFFGTSWGVVTHADWMAGGITAICGAAILAYLGAQGWIQRVAGPLLFGAACCCFFLFGAAPAESFPPPVPGFEVLVLFCLGLILGGAGTYLGYLESPPEKDLAAILLALGGTVLLAAGGARGLPESAGFLDGLAQALKQALEALARSGGFWRWSGLAVLWGAYRFAKFFRYDPEQWSRRKTSDGRIINWNK